MSTIQTSHVDNSIETFSENFTENEHLESDVQHPIEKLLLLAKNMLTNDLDAAYELVLQAEMQAKAENNNDSLAYAMAIKGNCLRKYNKTEEALELFSSALMLTNDPLILATTKNYMSFFYYRKEDYRNALYLATESLVLTQNIIPKDSFEQKVHSYNNLGLVYWKLNLLDDAMKNLLKASQLAKVYNDPQLRFTYI